MLPRCVLAALVLASLTGACTSDPTPAESIQAVSAPLATPDGTGGRNHPDVIPRDYVVLVSFDGFRHDYLDRVETPAFDRLSAEGVIADALVPPFPSLTFPTHYTIATGLYPADHGIVGNRFYDPQRDDEFDYRDRDDAQDGSWWGGEPIWVTAERQGMVAASFFFPGTEADVGGVRPSRSRAYDAGVPNPQRIDQALDWLRLDADERPHLITLYFSMVDGGGHRLGPDAPQMGDAIRHADRVLDQLMRGIDALPHAGKVYLVVVSDHGMAAVDADRQVLIRDHVDLRGVRAVPLGPGMSLHLGPGAPSATSLVERFNGTVDETRARAYPRGDAPPHLHVGDNARFGDVILVPADGVSILFRPDRTPPAGMHGWDPTVPSMQGIFLARGPGIEPGRRLPPFESIHIYPFLADVLDLVPHAPIDGDLSVLEPLVAAR